MSHANVRGETIPSLAQIFFGRLANFWRRRRVERAFTGRRLQFQAIEPRILLSADLIGDVHWDPVQSRAEESTELFVVDGALQGHESLLSGLAGSNPLILDRNGDGIEQITQALAQRSGVTAVHILSHGASGSVALGGVTLESSNLDSYEAQLQAWADSLTGDADILFYGCDVAAGEAGESFVDRLSGLTGADVAASADLTGSAGLGGDWDLEYSTGSIEVEPIVAALSGESMLLSIVSYDAAAGSLTFTADVGEADQVSVTAPGTDSLVIQVANTDSIVVSVNDNDGDGVSEGDHFVLSDANGGTNNVLTISLTGAPVAAFAVNLGDQDDSLDFGLANATGIGPVSLDGQGGLDTASLNATTLGSSLSVTAESINVNGTLSTAAASARAVDFFGGTTVLNADIETATGAITIRGNVILGSPALVTLDTTEGGTGSLIVVTGTVNDDSSASGLMLRAGTTGVVSLNVGGLGGVGNLVPIQGLTVESANAVRLPLVNTRDGGVSVTTLGSDPFIVLGGDINTTHGAAAAGNVSLTGPSRLGTDVQITAEHSTGADGNVSFAGATSTIDPDPNNPGARSLTISAGGGSVSFGGAIGGSQPLQNVTASGSSILVGGGSVTTTDAQTYNGAVTLGAGTVFSATSAAGVIAFNTSLAAGANNASISAREINLPAVADTVSGTGTLTLQPEADGTQIRVGANADSAVANLDIIDADIAALANGFGLITIGRLGGTGAITVDSSAFRDALTLRGGTITVSGALTTNAAGDGGALTLSAAGNTNVNADLDAGTGAISAPGSVIFSGARTVDADTFTVGSLNIGSGVTATLNADTTVNTSLSWSGGTITGGGVLTTSLGSTTALGNATLADKVWNNAGDVNLAAAGGQLTLGGSGAVATTFTNQAGGVVNDASNSGSPFTFNTTAANKSVVNAGTFNKLVGSAATQTILIGFSNSGTVNIDSGTLNLTGSGSDTGTYAVDLGQRLQFGGSTRTLGAGSSLEGAGNLQVSGGTVTANGTNTLSGSMTFSGGTTTFTQSITPGSLTVNGGTLNLNASPLTFTDNLSVSAGTLNAPGNITVEGAWSWSGGTITGGGVLTTSLGSTTALGNATLADKVWNNAGDVNLAAAGGQLTLGGSGAVATTFTNQAGGVVNDASNSGSPFTFNTTAANKSVVNAGTFNKLVGSAATQTILIGFSNSGTVNIDSGTLNLTGSGSDTGTYAVDLGQRLQFGGSTRTLGAGSSLEGAGNLQVSGGTVTANGTNTLSGSMTFSGGTTTFTQSITPGSLTVNGGTLNLNASPLTFTDNLSVSAGTLNAPGNITVEGAWSWSGGTITGGGVLTTSLGSTTALGNATLADKVWNNAGDVNLAAAGGQLTLGGSGAVATTFTNQAGGVVNDASNSGSPFTFNTTAANKSVVNAGTFNKLVGSAATQTILIGFSNSGTVNIDSGTLNLTGSGSDTGTYAVDLGQRLQFGGSTRTLGAGSSLEGAGNLQVSGGTVTANGTNTLSGSMTFSGGTTTFTQSITPGSLTVNGGTLNLNASPLTFTDNLSVSAGTLNAPGNITVEGAWSWSGGTITGGGVLTTSLGSTTALGNATLADKVWNNAGDVNLAAAGGQLTLGGSGAVATTFTNQAGGVVNDASNSGSPFTFNTTAANKSVVNAGTFNKLVGSAATQTILIGFSNSGTVNIDSGTLNLTGSGSDTGTYAVDLGQRLQFGGSTRTLGAGSSLEGAGNLQVSGGTVTANGTNTLSGSMTFSGGTTTFTQSITPGSLTVNGGTLNLNASPLTFTDNLSVSAGTLNAPGNITVEGAWSWSGGTITGGGVLTTSLGSTTALGNATLADKVWNNAGDVNLAAAGGDLTLGGDGDVLTRFTNQASGVVNDASNSGSPFTFNTTAANKSVVNAGTFNKLVGSAATQTILIGFSNSGTVNIDSGTLNLTGALVQTGTIDVDSGATFQRLGGFNNAGVLSGNGTINIGVGNTLTNSGAIRPGSSPGLLTVNGNVTFASASSFDVEVNGGTPGIGHDQLNVGGTVTLNSATLNATGTITPSPGQQIVLITNDGTDAILGTFNGQPERSTVTINGVGFFLSYAGGDGNDVTLRANTAPVLGSPVATFPSIAEDTVDPAGTSIGGFLAAILVTDADDSLFSPGVAPRGIAATGVDDTNGIWQFSLDGGGSWDDVGAVSSTSARLLDTSARLRFLPGENFNGTATFVFRAWDQSVGVSGDLANTIPNGGVTAYSATAATAAITVTPVNDAPVNTVPGVQAVNEDTSLVFSAASGNAISVSDVDDADNAIVGDEVVEVTLAVGHGVLSLGSLAGLSFTSGDGSGDAGMTFHGTLAAINAALDGLVYAPGVNFNGLDGLTISVDDLGNFGLGGPLSDTDSVAISVLAVNDAPVANPDSFSVDEDNTLTVSAPGLLGNDTDVDDLTLTATLVSSTTNGLLTFNADGSFTYTANANFNGTDSFTYKANDGDVDSNVTTVSLTVNAVNDAPVANPDSFSVDEDSTLTVSAPGLLGNDTDVDDLTLTATLVSSTTNGLLSFNADGSFSYTANANFNGTDSFTYKANDGEVDSNTTTVTLTVNAVNDAPVADPDSFSVDEDNTLTVSAPGLLGNDTDVDDLTLTATLVTTTTNGLLSFNADGSFTYTANVNFNGTDSFTYKANDGEVDSNTTTVTLTVTAVNDAPVANPDSFSVDEDNTLTVSAPGVLGNDTDVDDSTLTATLVTTTTNGLLSFNADGSFSYTPNLDFFGTDSFTYKANDGDLDSSLTTVTLTVNAANDAFLSNVHYDEDTDTLTFVSEGGAENNVTVTSPAVDRLRIVVGAGEAIFLSGDTSVGFLLSADGAQLDIDTSLAAINLFGIDLVGGDDTLFLTNDANNGLGSLTADGNEGSDSVTLNATSLGGSLSVTADSIVVDGTLTAAAGVTLTGTGNTTILNDDIITAGGAITINDSVILGDEVTVTLDTTNGGLVAAGSHIVFLGTIDDDLSASGLELQAGATGTVALAGSVGATLAPHDLSIGAGAVSIQAFVTTGSQSIATVGDVFVASFSNAAGLNATGAQIITAGGTLTVQGGAGSGLSARIVGSGGQTIDASSIVITGGSGGSSSFAEILQTGAAGTQEIEASSIAINGGTSGTNNFARIRNDGTGAQTVTVTGPLTLTGGTGGAPDLGNFAQIRAVGAQIIDAGDTQLFAGGAGFSNFAGIHGADQDITIHGTLTLTGGSSVAGPTSAGAARIGGIGGVVPGPTNLDLEVEGSVTMFGGTEVFAGAVIGSDFQGGQTTDITMLVGGSLTMHPGTVLNSGARIGSPSTNPAGGDISITVGGNIAMGGSLTVGALGTVIRTIGGEVTLDAGGAITIAGSVFSGAQTVSAGGNITVSATGVAAATLNATGSQTITAGGTLTVQGGSAGSDRFAMILGAGGQSITASGITIQGGNSGINSFAEIRQTGLGANQAIVVTGGGTLSMRGGLGGADNFASIRGDGVSQTITVNGGTIALTGGNGPDVAVPPTDTSNNFARIQSSASQTINADTIALNGALSGTNNFTSIQGPNQRITTTGDVTLSGGFAAASNSGSRIGGTGGTSPTNLVLDVGGDLALTAGAVSGATLGSPAAGGGNTNIVISVDGDFIADGTGGGTVRIGSPEAAVSGGDIEIHAGLGGAGDIVFSGRAQLRTLGEVTLTTPGTLSLTGGSSGSGNAALIESGGNQTIDASNITLTGGSVGNSNFAQIYQTGALGGQSIDASSITINGGTSGTNNFARIRNDGTGAQTVTVTGPLTLTGGTGGAPDLGNFAQIRAVGAQIIDAGDTQLFAGGAGFSNFAGIHGADQDITIHGTLTLTGGSSVAGPTSAGAARIGGIGGVVPGPTNLDLEVEGSVTMFGGTEVFAGAVIGSDFQGGQTTDITMLVGGSLTMHPGTVLNSGARIGSPSTNPAGGDISITVGGNIAMGGSLTVGALGTVIRTIGGEVTLDAGGAITIAGSVFSGAQTVSAGGNITVSATGVAAATLNATGSQTITAGGTLTVQGGAGTGLSARIVGGAGQTIDASNILVSGGSVGDSSFADIMQTGALAGQSIDASSITINGGTSGTNNFANITGANQLITVTGNVTLTSGTGAGNGPRIGGIGNIATNLVLNAGGDVVLQGGNSANTAPAIGNPTVPIQMATNIVVNAGGDVILNAGSATGARIGSSANFPAGGGDISISAGGDIQLNGTTQVSRIRTLGNVTLHADSLGGTISEGPNGLIQANLLTTTSNGDTTLTGPNQVAAFNGSSVSGNISFNNTSTLLTVTGISQAPSAALVLSQVGNLTFTGNAFSGTQTISATGNITISPLGGPGASVFAAGVQSVTAGGGLIVQSSAAGPAQLQASGGQTINAGFVEVTAQDSLAIISNGGSGDQLITTTGMNAAGEGLAVRNLGDAGAFATVQQNVPGGKQVISINNANRVTVDGFGGNALIFGSGDSQTVLISGATSTNALTLGRSGSVGASQIVGGGIQSVTAGSDGEQGSITILGRDAGSGGNSLISSQAVPGGTQTVSTSGLLTVIGGSASAASSAGVFANGTDGQIVSAEGITLQGGSAGSGNSALVNSNNGSQQITAGAGGITLIGGAGGSNNNGQIRQTPASGSQTITVDGGNIALQSGAGGTNNGAFLIGANQELSATGNVTMTGGGGALNGLRIGNVDGAATRVKINAGGDVLLTGGSPPNTAPVIGNSNVGTPQPNDIAINAGGSVILNSSAVSGVRIGSFAGLPATGGDVSVNAGGDIQLNGTTAATRIRTLGNVTLTAGGAIVEGANGIIEAGALTTTSEGGTILVGPNQVAVFNATNTNSGNVTLVDADGLTVTGISNPVGEISVSTTGQMTVTGSLDSGTHDMALTASGGVSFTASAMVNVDLGGTAANQFTTVTILGQVTLDGTLDVDLVNGFMPADTNRFPFMTFDSRTGFFGTTDLPAQFYVDQSDATDLELVFDTTSPTVTINQAAGQADPTNASPISFTVLFSEAVFDFTESDVSLAGSTVGGTLEVDVVGSGALYTVLVTGMTSSGLVQASVVTNAANDAAGNFSTASTSTDNTVTFDNVAPTVTINQSLGQEDPTNDSPISFTVLFSEAVFDFTENDVSLAGSTVGGTLEVDVIGSGALYTVLVTGMTSSGLVQASVVSNAATDAAGNFSSTSTSTDNVITFEAATAGIDLVGAVEWDPDDLLIPGDHEHVTVVVSNNGDTAVHQQVKVKLYASADEELDASDIFLDQRLTVSGIEAGSSSTAQFNLIFPSKLLPGAYFLLAEVDPADQVPESDEENNTASGGTFDFHWMFGEVPDHGWRTLTVRDADGTWVNFSLLGPGTGEITIDEEGNWDLLVTGTTGSSILSILTLGGGNHRVTLDDIHVTGALRGILAPKMDLTGTLAIDGALGAGMMIGSATEAVIAVQTILGRCLSGLSVQGIAILGDLEDSEILIGADLGADGQLGGAGANADTYSAGDLGDLLITGCMDSSYVRVGQDPVDGIFDNGDDVLLDGSIDSIIIRGEMTDDSFFVADDLPRYACIDGWKVYIATDPRFIDSLPSSGDGVECDIDWNACSWGAGYSPFGSSGQSNFSDFLVRLFG